jgi:hypothetical protein
MTVSKDAAIPVAGSRPAPARMLRVPTNSSRLIFVLRSGKELVCPEPSSQLCEDSQCEAHLNRQQNRDLGSWTTACDSLRMYCSCKWTRA